MGGVRMAVYALLLLAALVAVDWGFGSSTDSSTQDARLVYCLAPVHQGSLVTAAVSLGLAGPGSAPDRMAVAGRQLTLAKWRTADGPDFDRACDALADVSLPAPSGGDSSGTPGILAILLPVVAGALLTLAADDFKQASDRRWAQADELRADWQEFAGAVLSYADTRRDSPAGGIPWPAQADETRRYLTAILRKIHSQHRGSPTIRALQDTLTKGKLGSAIADGRVAGSDQQSVQGRVDRAGKIKTELESAEASLDRIAVALERRIWLSRKL